MKRLARAALIIVCTSLAWVNPAAADVIAEWNLNALGVIAAGRGATPAAIIDIAMVQAAVHDAIQAYDQRFETYAGPISATSGASVNQSIVAAAKAARDVLVARFPAQQATVDGLYATSIAGISAEDVSAGEVIGNLAAAHLLAVRAGDGSFPSTFTQFPGSNAIGVWRAIGTPGMAAPWLGAVRPFVIPGPENFQPDAIPALTSIEYAEAYSEVQALGSATSTLRTPEQGALARMYSGNFLGQFNRLLREIAAAHLPGTDVASLGDRARLFALANLATADAIICAWESKKKFAFWRPSHAIQSGDDDGNILTAGDPSWAPYLPNPNYPDYTSGANNVTAAMTRTLALFFGSDQPFEFGINATNPGIPLASGDPNPRMYSRFSDVAKDVVDARIYLGIHFRFADTEAWSQGRRVANYAFRNFLRPIK